MAVKFQDYYQVLGVERSASQDDLQKAFRKLARKFHPDVNKSPRAEDRFKQINEAYEVLKDPETRKQYDLLGANWKAGQDFQPPPGWAAGNGAVRVNLGDMDGAGGFSDFFSSLFGGGGGVRGGSIRGFEGMGGFGQAGPGAGTWSQRGDDREAEIDVTLAEAFHGAKKSVRFKIAAIGPDGAPRAGEIKSYEVTIPKGVTGGSRIRLSGQGGPGLGGAPNGDLLLLVRLLPHPGFTVHAHDLRSDVLVTPWEAALGAEVSIPTLAGAVTLKIPSGTQGGQTMRLRGRGLPKQRGPDGDLLATVRVAVPKELSPRERELFEQLAASSEFDPRGAKEK